MTSKKRRTTPSRRRWSEAEARSMLLALERSGESVVAFARSQGVSAQRVYWWRKRLGPTGSRTNVPDDVSLVPVRVRYEDALGLEAEDRAPAIVVRSVGGVNIELPTCVEPGWIAALTRNIEGR
ncbi:MAG: transposase [Deltaproteobacteria bacterium]|nr:transposase [Deltaproteobacteria bacterium]